MASPALEAFALGDALGVPWVGAAPRTITRRRLLDDVGPTGEATRIARAADDAWASGSPNGELFTTRRPGSSDAGADALALPVAFVIGLREADADARRAAALPLGLGAVVVADLTAWALERRPIYQSLTDHANKWGPPFHGVALDQRAIIDSLLATLARHDEATEGMLSSVRLGGNGVAVLTALVGGILAAKLPTAVARIPWSGRVV
ncbi:hypothetical protein [Baekduia sp. Peel2402]|uniref:hypothetical protein n=1 Tax=Baekduia sp. Peel2402 TaxID=3458296 RepID=UPI00403E485E